jgi:hypothetical protein
MALIDKASLLMVPSTYEAGTLYNVLPSGNRAPDSTDQNSGYDQTRADFDFDRGSNAAATRVNADGLIEKYRENTLEHSNNFNDASYTKVKTSFTSGQLDKDGGTNAWKYQCSSNGASYFYKTPSTNSGIRTRSIYAKAGTASQITFLWDSFNQNEHATFDLANGTFTNAGCLANMESVGDGWYRCTTTITDSANTYALLIGLADKSGSASTAGDNVYIMYAQQEAGLVATDYLDSTSVTGKAGVLVDLPRINYDANGENGALLLEPSRANLVQHSEYHSSSTYGNQNVSIVDNDAVSPEGLQNAAKIVLDNGTNTSNGGHYFSFNSTASTNYTISVFAKAGEYRYFTFTYGSSAAGGGHFDLQEGTLLGTITNANYSNVNPSIEDYGNGWYRLIISLTDNNSVSGRFLSMKPSPSASVPSNNNYSSTGDGTSGAYIYGFQLEASATYASSYIPNHGESGGVTRAADVCNGGGNTESINSTEGVLYVEISALVNGGENRVLSISDGSYDNSVRIQFYTNTNEIEMRIVTGNAVQALQRVAITNTLNFNKIALKYKANDFQLWINGSKLRFDTSGTMPSANTFNVLNFDDGDGNNDFYGNVKQVAVFNEALSDSELATLTTL